MKQEDVIELAEKAGFIFHDAGYAPTLHTLPREYSQKCFERLVSAVEQATLERSATICAVRAQELNDAANKADDNGSQDDAVSIRAMAWQVQLCGDKIAQEGAQ